MKGCGVLHELVELPDLGQLFDQLEDDHHEAGELHLLCLPIQVVWQELEELVQHVAGDHPQYSSTRP